MPYSVSHQDSMLLTPGTGAGHVSGSIFISYQPAWRYFSNIIIPLQLRALLAYRVSAPQSLGCCPPPPTPSLLVMLWGGGGGAATVKGNESICSQYYTVIIKLLMLRSYSWNCQLDRQFPENLPFGQAKNSMQNFHLDFLGVITKYFPIKPSPMAEV